MNKILIIEDEEIVRQSIAELLEMEDYKVFEAPDGYIGLEIANNEIPDLIICDINMPKFSGYEVLKEIRLNDKTSTIPFIFLSAKAEAYDRRLGMELGADDYLTKPFSKSELFNAIKTRIVKSITIENKIETKLNELKLRLTSNIPHEFRTPLNGILATSQFLLQEFDSIESKIQKELLSSINQSAQRLNRLINNYLNFVDLELLSYDKIKMQKLLMFNTENIDYLIKVHCEKAAEKVSRKEDLIFDINPAILNLDEKYFVKIIEELLDNALKFSENGNKIYFKGNISTITPNLYHLAITDYGQGMSEENINSISSFTQFNRNIFEQQGAGLGLAIVKKIVNIHNGEFSIISKVGDGTKVSIYLPIFEN